MKSHPKAGSVNLKGKLSVMLRCKCCQVYDFRPKERAREALAEMRIAALKSEEK